MPHTNLSPRDHALYAPYIYRRLWITLAVVLAGTFAFGIFTLDLAVVRTAVSVSMIYAVWWYASRQFYGWLSEEQQLLLE